MTCFHVILLHQQFFLAIRASYTGSKILGNKHVLPCQEEWDVEVSLNRTFLSRQLEAVALKFKLSNSQRKNSDVIPKLAIS